MMVVPLVSRGRVIGSIELDSLSEVREFTADEQELLLTVAAAIAAAVENARLFAAEQEARRTADTLREVARVLSSSFDPAEVLQLILRELQHVVQYDTASIMLRDGPMLRLAAFRGNAEMLQKPKRTLFKLDRQRADGLVLSRRAPLMIADTSQSPDWVNAEESPDVRSWLGVPLLNRGAVLGVLNINATHVNRFTPRDMEAALAFASQAAVALENARLYQESVTRVEQELDIARRIQSNLFPRSLPQLPGLALDARCIPARETGGDFYDVVMLSEQRVAVMVGDVSGKSIPAAMLMAVARSITRSEARNHEIPQTVMRETNRWIVRDVPHHTFVALSYATLDLECRRLALANAGQLTPIRRRADGQIEYLEPPGPRLPLGTIPDIAYDALEVLLDPGDLLIFYTDGIVEAQNDRHELFGFERLEMLLRDYGDLTPSQFIDRLMQAIAEFTGNTAQHDDITLMVAYIRE
jgi:serine phosphatase RsbU (regulator of sigma subunit)